MELAEVVGRAAQAGQQEILEAGLAGDLDSDGVECPTGERRGGEDGAQERGRVVVHGVQHYALDRGHRGRVENQRVGPGDIDVGLRVEGPGPDLTDARKEAEDVEQGPCAAELGP